MSEPSHAITYKVGIEMPTWLLIAGVYTVWCLLIGFYASMHPLIWLILMVPVLALFGSLCHELLHGHPSNNQKLNDAMGTPPLSLYPYFDYKRTHLKHHHEQDITKPDIDPESFFIRAEDWKQLPRWKQKLAWVNMTLAGRLLLGPARSYLALFKQCFADVHAEDTRVKQQWFSTILSVIILIGLIVFIFKVPIGMYLLAVYFGHSVIALRSFYEHQAHPESKYRTVIIPTVKPLSFVYLYNNLHVVHHQHPGLAWYLIPAEYRRNRQSYHQSNGGFTYRGYHDWLKFLFQPIASPVFPEFDQSL